MPNRKSPLARRIESAYQRETGADSVRGAYAWFAREAGITPNHLSRVLRGRQPWQPRYERLLERMERG